MTQRSSPWLPIAIIVGFFVLLGLLEAASFGFAALRAGRPITFGSMLAGTLPSWVIQLALVWPVVALARRVHLGPGRWRRNVPLHVLGALLFTVVTVIGTLFMLRLFGKLEGVPLTRVFLGTVLEFAPTQVSIYAAMVGIVHALDYWRESEQRERERARLAASLVEARLQSLRSQLSPHFFFNTLNTISTLALQGRAAALDQMIGSLGDLVRASLDEGLPHRVPLRRELKLLDLYLEIQRARFEDWLRIEQHIDPRTLDVLVPSLMLQPLIENAIEHGVPSADGWSRIRLRCELAGDAIEIEVRNRIGPPSAAATPSSRRGVGVRNTRERLEQIHPGRSLFEFGALDGVAVILARFPAERVPREDATREYAAP